MGCFSSKKRELEFVVPPQQGNGGSAAAGKPSEDGLSLLPGSPQHPAQGNASDGDYVSSSRLSVRYQTKEYSGRGSASARKANPPFDRSLIGTQTRHGLMPGPRGFSAAKINQDRGLVCWPFNGSHNQALLCVFDGHGSKGESASEFCMKTIPELLERDSSALKSDPSATLSKVVIKADELLLGSPSLGKTAMTCGTTSTVCYLHGNDLWVACSGDSRAVKGSRRNGAILAEDLSVDHKPDLPEEKRRIQAAGGSVSDTAAGRPARVWAHGRIGLAMSRSIGDGECKKVGVIPDPEITHTVVAPAASMDKDGGDGDLFVIVASDGIWEFIQSAEACALVYKHKSATDACSALVLEAAQRWKRFEGSYRDDITCIVAHLPFLRADRSEEQTTGQHTDSAVDEESMYVSVPVVARNDLPDEDVSAPAENGGQDFASRRLSVHNPYDDDWNSGDDSDGRP